MRKLLRDEPSLVICPSLACEVGLNEAIILQQIHYWINPKHNKNFIEGRYWVYKTYEEWLVEFPFWSESTVKRTLSSLKEAGFIECSFHSEDKRDRTVWYTINYDATNASGQNDPIPLGQNDPMEGVKMTRCNKEQRLHTEITTENKTNAREVAGVLVENPEVVLEYQVGFPDNQKNRNFEMAFAMFWELYPSKKARQGAKAAFLRGKCHLYLPEILKSLHAQILEFSQKQELGLFCPEWPHPTTWINQRRWEDEVVDRNTLVQKAAKSQMSGRTLANSKASSRANAVLGRMVARSTKEEVCL